MGLITAGMRVLRPPLQIVIDADRFLVIFMNGVGASRVGEWIK
jgi:hypothetical protein